jgi:ankyrin repeat protein
MDPNEKNIYKRNALHFASTGGHLDIVQYLIREHQMDPNEKDINGQSAVDMASEKPDILLFFKNYKFTKLVLRSLGLINILN